MVATAGWEEPFQTSEFDEYTYIIKGRKLFIIAGETIVLSAGELLKLKKMLAFSVQTRLTKNVNI